MQSEVKHLIVLLIVMGLPLKLNVLAISWQEEILYDDTRWSHVIRALRLKQRQKIENNDPMNDWKKYGQLIPSSEKNLSVVDVVENNGPFRFLGGFRLNDQTLGLGRWIYQVLNGSFIPSSGAVAHRLSGKTINCGQNRIRFISKNWLFSKKRLEIFINITDTSKYSDNIDKVVIISGLTDISVPNAITHSPFAAEIRARNLFEWELRMNTSTYELSDDWQRAFVTRQSQLIRWWQGNIQIKSPEVKPLPLGPNYNRENLIALRQAQRSVAHRLSSLTQSKLSFQKKNNFTNNNSTETSTTARNDNNTSTNQVFKKRLLLLNFRPVVRHRFPTRGYIYDHIANDPEYLWFATVAPRGTHFNVVEDANNGSSSSDYFDLLSYFHFVMSPAGNGIDCYRTWEAIALGVIPIVHSYGPMDQLYSDLPVLIVNTWLDITFDLLISTLNKFQRRTSFNFEKIRARGILRTILADCGCSPQERASIFKIFKQEVPKI